VRQGREPGPPGILAPAAGRAVAAAGRPGRSEAGLQRAKLREQQCGESKRILVVKKARPDLAEAERVELRRFEENYLARCA
jgi:hypothetical protein